MSAQHHHKHVSGASVFRKTQRTASRVIDGEAVIVQPGDGLVNVFNEPATRIWELVDGVRGVQTIAAMIAEEYDVSEGQAMADTIAFLVDLSEKGLVEAVA